MEPRGMFLRRAGTLLRFRAIMVVSLSLCFAGCSDQVDLPTMGQLLEFDSAGPVCPVVDVDRLVRARIGGGPYRVVPGDVVELTMPAILQVVTAQGSSEAAQATPYVCRVNDSGAIRLPVVGNIAVSGRTLAQIEEDVINAYYPEYTVVRPSVFARVLEYTTAKVSIVGAVQNSGIYSLRSDQMSLVALLMEAGGIIDDGAARISIVHQSDPPASQEKSARKALGQQGLHGPGASQAVPMDVGLSFKQTSSSSTIGELTITNMKNEILVIDQLDVTQETERQALLRRLAVTEPRVSTVEVNKRLCALAEQLQPASGYHNRGTALTDPRIHADTGPMVRLAATNVMTMTNSEKPSAASQGSLCEQMSEPGEESYRTLRGQNSSVSTSKIPPPPSKETESLVLPVKGFNIPFADVMLRDGDSVIVERLQPPLFTVMGLVNRPGNFPYPPDIQYNLVQALAFAGGLNEVADPRYVTIYRLDAHGKIVSAVFPILNGAKLTDAANTSIKPGDIVSVEHTPRTRTAVFLDRIFRINIGTYLRLEDAWD